MGEKLKVIADNWHGCRRCDLGKERSGHKIVFGLGSEKAKYLLVYDTPTESDVQMGAPMTGLEGDLLVALLEKAEIPLAEVYCAPLLGCRPTVALPATDFEEARVADRAPLAPERKACFPRVVDILYRVDPLVVFTMGPEAFLQMVRGPDRGLASSLDKALDELFVTRLPGLWIPEITYPVIPLLSMKQITQKPSAADHGPMAITAKALHKGRTYAAFLEKANGRDAQLSGYVDKSKGRDPGRDGPGDRTL